MKIPKINSIHFGLPWILISIFAGGVLPAAIWILFHVFAWWLCAVGAVSLFVFFVVLAIEMKQDSGKVPYYVKELKSTIPFDPETQYAVIKSSICTGEKMAGFKNRSDGKFTEVMLIQSEADKRQFMEIYGLDEVSTEY